MTLATAALTYPEPPEATHLAGITMMIGRQDRDDWTFEVLAKVT